MLLSHKAHDDNSLLIIIHREHEESRSRVAQHVDTNNNRPGQNRNGENLYKSKREGVFNLKQRCTDDQCMTPKYNETNAQDPSALLSLSRYIILCSAASSRTHLETNDIIEWRQVNKITNQEN